MKRNVFSQKEFDQKFFIKVVAPSRSSVVYVPGT